VNRKNFDYSKDKCHCVPVGVDRKVFRDATNWDEVGVYVKVQKLRNGKSWNKTSYDYNHGQLQFFGS
jgi:hypothetical protein